MTVQLRVPDLGDFADVEVIEILVLPGDVIAVEDPLITLETDKASMDVPASDAGTIVSVDVRVGDRVSTGTAVVTIEPSESAAPDAGDECRRHVDNVGTGYHRYAKPCGQRDAQRATRRYRCRPWRLYRRIPRRGPRPGCHPG